MPRKRKISANFQLQTPAQTISALDRLQLVWMNPQELAGNPLNWRIHPPRQRKSYLALKSQVGWAGAVLYNLATKRMIDGHMRVDEAQRNQDGQVPVLCGHWTEEQEKLILASLDPIAAMAQTDHAALKSLSQANEKTLAGKRALGSNRLRKLTKELGNYAQAVEQGSAPSTLFHSEVGARVRNFPETETETGSEEETGYTPPEEDAEMMTQPEIKDEVFFQCDNEWHLPELLPGFLAQPEQAPDQTWDRTERTLVETAYFCHSARRFLFKAPYSDPGTAFTGGVLGFFTEDWRFEHVYEYPSDYAQQLLEEQWTAVLAPDFSLYESYPFPLRLWNLYRSRWCARYWQELGIKIIPVIQNLESNPLGMGPDYHLTLETLPHPCPVIALQCRTLHHGCTYEGFAGVVNTAVEELEPELVLIYGGYEHQRKFHGYLTRGPEYRMLESYTGRRKRKRQQVDGKTLPAMGVPRPQNRVRKSSLKG